MRNASGAILPKYDVSIKSSDIYWTLVSEGDINKVHSQGADESESGAATCAR